MKLMIPNPRPFLKEAATSHLNCLESSDSFSFQTFLSLVCYISDSWTELGKQTSQP